MNRLRNDGLIKSKPFFDKGFWWVQGLSSTFPVKCISKIFNSKKIVRNNFFSFKKIFGQKMFLVKKCFWSKKFFGQKMFFFLYNFNYVIIILKK